MRWLALLLTVTAIGCAAPAADHPRPSFKEPRRSAAAAALADHWQASVFGAGDRSRWKRTRRACRNPQTTGDATLCAVLDRKLRGDREWRHRRRR